MRSGTLLGLVAIMTVGCSQVKHVVVSDGAAVASGTQQAGATTTMMPIVREQTTIAWNSIAIPVPTFKTVRFTEMVQVDQPAHVQTALESPPTPPTISQASFVSPPKQKPGAPGKPISSLTNAPESAPVTGRSSKHQAVAVAPPPEELRVPAVSTTSADGVLLPSLGTANAGTPAGK